MRTYNLFRRADRDELICAVPEDRPVPSFITGPPWDFVGRVNESAIGSLSFNHEAAEASVQWNGFYLFQLVNASNLHLRARQKAPERPSEIRLACVEVELEVEVEASSDNRASFLPSVLDNADLHLVRK